MQPSSDELANRISQDAELEEMLKLVVQQLKQELEERQRLSQQTDSAD